MSSGAFAVFQGFSHTSSQRSRVYSRSRVDHVAAVHLCTLTNSARSHWHAETIEMCIFMLVIVHRWFVFSCIQVFRNPNFPDFSIQISGLYSKRLSNKAAFPLINPALQLSLMNSCLNKTKRPPSIFNRWVHPYIKTHQFSFSCLSNTRKTCAYALIFGGLLDSSKRLLVVDLLLFVLLSVEWSKPPSLCL